MALAELRFAVYGAGIAGLGIATALRRRGFKNVSVFERAGSREAGGRAKGALLLPANAVRILDTWRTRKELVHAEMEQVGTQGTNGRIIVGTDQKALSRDSLPAIRNKQIPDSPPIGVSVSEILRRLEEPLVAGGVPVEYQRALKTVEIDPEEGWEITLAFLDGEQATCDVLIAADGMESAIKRGFFDETGPGTNAEQWWVSGTCHFEDYPKPNTAFECKGNGTRLWASNIGDGQVGWRGVVYNDKSPYPESPEAAGDLAEIFRPAPSHLIDAVRATENKDVAMGRVEWTTPRQGWNRYSGRLVLLGDAAHTIPDALFQDVAMTLESCEALSMAYQQMVELHVPSEAQTNPLFRNPSNLADKDEDEDDVAEEEDEIGGLLRRAAVEYENARFARVKKVWLDSSEEQKVLNTSSSIMAGLRATADWMNRFSSTIQDKELVAYDVFQLFGPSAHRVLNK